ncbi:MAG: protein kinase [Acidobacteriota bacterium]
MDLDIRVTLDDIFQTVCDLPPDKRSAYLNEACAGDESMRREVEELIRYYETNKTFLEKPAIQDVAHQMAESGAINTPAPEPLIGKIIGNYRILSTIFAGGMGEVYLARDLNLDVDVAIKFLRREFHDDPEWQARLEREARLQAGLKHPNIVGIHYKGEFDGRPFLVFEFVPGETLKDRLDRGPLPIKEALPLFSQLAEALEYAHDNGIIHRDLKPSNLMVTPAGQVKVLDFGIAKKISADLATIELGIDDDDDLTRDYGKTRKGEVMGTVAYMSPEQTRGEPLDARTDLWAFGCVLYESLAGKRPFGGINTYDILNSIRSDEPDWDALPHQTPKSIRELLQHCLQKSLRHRPESAGEAKQAIDQLISPPHPRRMSLQHQMLIALMALFLLSAAVASGVKLRSWWIRSAIPAEKQFVVLPFKGFSNEQAGVGFADELRRNLLSLSDELHAAPLESRNLSALDLRAIQNRSGASLIVSGDVQQTSDQIRIRFRVSNSYLYDLLNEEISGPAKNLAELQNRIAEQVAQKLKLTTSARAATFGKQLKLGNTQATEQYLIAIGELQKDLNRESVEKPIEILTRLIESEGGSARLQSALARAYLNKYHFTKASEWLEKALQFATQAINLSPDQPEVYQVSRGLVYVEMGKPEEALKDFAAASDRYPEDWEALNGSAQAFRLAEDFKKAEQIYIRMIQLWPNYWDGYNELGDFYAEQGSYDKAIENWQRVVALLPDSPVGYINLASAYLQTDQQAKAIENYLIAINKDQTRDSFEALTNLGTVYFEQQQYDLARTYFQQALDVAKEAGRQDARLFGNLADAYRQLAPAQTLPNLADEYSRQAAEMYDNAINLTQQKIADHTAEADTLANLAEWLAKRRKTTEAIPYLQQALIVDSQSLEIAYSATIVYLLAGDINKSLNKLETVACGGYSIARLDRDPELQLLRLDPRYMAIMAKCQPTKR